MKLVLLTALTITFARIAPAHSLEASTTYDLFDPQKTGITFQIGYSAGVHEGTITAADVKVVLGQKNKVLSGQFIIPISAMHTGNETRDCHMREALGIDYKNSQFPNDHVCNSKDQTPESGPDSIVYPTIEFKFVNVKSNSNSELPEVLEVGKVYTLAVQGIFSMHGIHKDFSQETSTEFVPIQVKLLNAQTGEIQIAAKFPISLKEYGITVKPFKFGFVKINVADDAKVTVNMKISPLK